MHRIHKHALITDDAIFGSIVSSYFYKQNYYFPIISVPRMGRNDWSSEVFKRVTSINRARFKTIFCKWNDYELLAPLRSKLNVELIPIKTVKELHKFSDFTFPTKKLYHQKKDYLNGLILSVTDNNILELGNEINNSQNTSLKKQKINSETLVVIVIKNEITDVSAVNYALSNSYDILLIDPISTDTHNEIDALFRDLSINTKNHNKLLSKLDLKIKSIIDYREIETKYKQILFVVSEIPIGILIENIPVAHLNHLQSELRLLDETYYLSLKMNENFLPSAFFVDIQSKDLISEIPEINNDLDKFKIWRFNINGKYITRDRFKVYSRFFPFDLMFVSGHGAWPNCREVIYGFKSRNNQNHTIKLLEYFQFGERKNDKIHVETKIYPLEIDGISWRDKDTLQRKGISHLFKEYVSIGRGATLIEEKNADPKQIEGLLLYDGVFLGTVDNYTLGNNPIIFLNTCGSLYKVGKLLDFAGARGLIGTMWSIYDSDANIMAKSFFKNIPHHSVLKAFFKAKNKLDNKYSKLSYVYFGTLNSYLPLKRKIIDESISRDIMAKRLFSSLKEGVQNYIANSISGRELKFLLNLKIQTEKFINTNTTKNIQLRNRVRTLGYIVDLFK